MIAIFELVWVMQAPVVVSAALITAATLAVAPAAQAAQEAFQLAEVWSFSLFFLFIWTWLGNCSLPIKNGCKKVCAWLGCCPAYRTCNRQARSLHQWWSNMFWCFQGEPLIVQIGWSASAAVFSFSLALVVWGRSGMWFWQHTEELIWLMNECQS